MIKILSALLVVLCLAIFGAPLASALDSSPSVTQQDGDKGKKKGGKKKHHGKKKGAHKKHKHGKR